MVVYRLQDWFINKHGVSDEMCFNMWKAIERNRYKHQIDVVPVTRIPKAIAEMEEKYDLFYHKKKGEDFNPFTRSYVTPLYLEVKGWDKGYSVTKSVRYPNLRVLKYNRSTFYHNGWDKALIEMRGMVVDENNRIVVRPFNKVFNYSERLARDAFDPIEPLADDKLVYAVEKINGFLGVATYDPVLETVIYSTTGSLDSDYARLVEKHLSPYENMFHANSGVSFMFEICDELDPHIIKEELGAYLIGARIVTTGVPYAEIYLDSLAEAYNIRRPRAFTIAFGALKEKLRTSTIEGYMVYFNGGNCFKLKSLFYLLSKMLGRSTIDNLPRKLHKLNWDEEYYPLLDYVKENLAAFEVLPEQDKISFVQDFFIKELL